MVQIIEENRRPSFSDKLFAGLGQAAREGSVGIPQMLGKQLQGRKENEALKRLFGEDYSGISPDLKKLIISGHMKGWQQGERLASAQQAKQHQEDQESQRIGDSLDWLDENIEYTGTNVIPFMKSFTAGGLNREAVEKREEFDKTGFWAADQLFTKFNKGVLNKEKFKELKENLAPRSDLSERKNKARISALRRLAKLPDNISPAAFDKQYEKELKAVGKIDSVGEKPPLESFYE